MTTTTHLLRARRFLPLFVTQLLGAFNDNLFKNAMVLFVVFSVYNSEKAERALFGHGDGAVHHSLRGAFGAVGPIGRHARQGPHHPHRENLRNRHHGRGRNRPAAGVEGLPCPSAPSR
jgi:hypothetical protein